MFKNQSASIPGSENLRSRSILNAFRALLLGALVLALLYTLASYGALPSIWRYYESKHPALSLAPTRAFTAQGIPGDPNNLAVIGSREELMDAARIGALSH